VTVQVRTGGPTDVPAAVAVWQRAHEARTGAPVTPEVVVIVQDRMGLPDAWLVVAEDDSVVGMASGLAGRADDGAGPVVPGLCHLGMVFVEPLRWGEGIGHALVSAAVDQAAGLGYRRIQLWTHETNERAQRLYRSHGFAPSGRTMTDDHGELIGHWIRDL
jgi:GNAT superfamily N-acetyltransferase